MIALLLTWPHIYRSSFKQIITRLSTKAPQSDGGVVIKAKCILQFIAGVLADSIVCNPYTPFTIYGWVHNKASL